MLKYLVSGVQLALSLTGIANLWVILAILSRRRHCSSTSGYVISLCLANFCYLTCLMMVVVTQLNDASWPFGPTICHVYYALETAGKFASILFTALLSAERYRMTHRSSPVARNSHLLCFLAWSCSISASVPMALFSDAFTVVYASGLLRDVCVISWPSMASARWYVVISSAAFYLIPLAVILYCQVSIVMKLRHAAKRTAEKNRRHRIKVNRHRYYGPTILILIIVTLYVICWSPYWLFNMVSALVGFHVQSETSRFLTNIVHALPYLNCAVTPVIFALQTKRYRSGFSLFLVQRLVKVNSFIIRMPH